MAKEKANNHYSPEMINFFLELSNNNNKEWFDKNRDFYDKKIKTQSKNIVSELAILFTANNLPYIADPKYSLFRINRDIRFSTDKSPYKTNLGLFFPYSTDISNVSKEMSMGLYFHFEPGKSFAAIGIHSPDKTALHSIRKSIAENYEEFFDIINYKEFKKCFPDSFSSQKPLTRLKDFPADHPAIEYLKRKDFVFSQNINDNIFFSDNFFDYITDKARAGMNFSDFLYRSIYE